MNKNKGFGRSTSKYKNQIITIKKLMNIGNFSKAEKLLLSLEAKNQLDHIGFHLLGMIYKLKSDYLIALKLLNKSINLVSFMFFIVKYVTSDVFIILDQNSENVSSSKYSDFTANIGSNNLG